MIKSNIFNNYFNYSKDFFTSILFITPLLILYELLAYFIFHNTPFIIRNSADVAIKNLFNHIGLESDFIHFLIFGFLILLYLIFNYQKYKLYTFRINYLFLMYLEGIILGFLLLIILNGYKFLYSFNFSYYESFYIYFYYCLGAGIWEEILFRLIIFSLFMYLFKIITTKQISMIISITLSSLMFSLIHYIGPYADIFTINTFIIRFVGGVVLCLIYINRGLGISCMTHYSYDVLLLTIPLI